jgi:hypothetical protein
MDFGLILSMNRDARSLTSRRSARSTPTVNTRPGGSEAQARNGNRRWSAVFWRFFPDDCPRRRPDRSSRGVPSSVARPRSPGRTRLDAGLDVANDRGDERLDSGHDRRRHVPERTTSEPNGSAAV